MEVFNLITTLYRGVFSIDLYESFKGIKKNSSYRGIRFIEVRTNEVQLYIYFKRLVTSFNLAFARPHRLQICAWNVSSKARGELVQYEGELY